MDAIADGDTSATEWDLSLRSLTSAKHIVREATGDEYVILRDSSTAVTLRCQGGNVGRAPVNITLQNRLSAPDAYATAVTCLADLLLRPANDPDCTRTRLLLRDALIAIDGKCLGASYREIAIIIYGLERVQTEWVGASRWMKDHICRAYAKGEQLRDGGYLELLGLECRSS